MNKEIFINAITSEVYESTLSSVVSKLKHPPGRQPSAELVKQSQWFNSLENETKEMVQQIIKIAAHDAVFGVLAVLDGVRAIEGYGDKGELKLFFEKGNSKQLLNNGEGETLHDLFNEKTR